MAAVAVDAAVLVAVEVEVKEEPMARTRPSVCGLALAQEGRRVRLIKIKCHLRADFGQVCRCPRRRFLKLRQILGD